MIEALKSLKKKMHELDVLKSKGVIILRNGESIELDSMFSFINDLWILWNKKELDEEEQDKLFTAGSIISIKNVTIDLDDISTMIKFEEKPRKQRSKRGVSIDKSIEFLKRKRNK